MSKKLGVPLDASRSTWVQTERAAHEAWSKLTRSNPMASALMHKLVGSMGHQNAVVVSQKVLAKMLDCSPKTIGRAIEHLAAENWIQVVRIGTGTVNAYVVNDQVAWGEKRESMRLSLFSASVIADFDEQSEHQLNFGSLRKIPVLFPGEIQLPTGPGEAPPSQPFLEGIETELPALEAQLLADKNKRIK